MKSVRKLMCALAVSVLVTVPPVVEAQCRTVCEAIIVMGPDGKPVPQVVCRLRCDL